jgi:ABC-type dipeptide/oligopeptide/nickel transport system permease component
MVQFLVLAVAFTMVVSNLIVDALYLLIDPRIRAR